MYFGPYGFVCERCGLIYPPGHLLHHMLSKKHSGDLDITGPRKVETYEAILSHLLMAHGVPKGLSTFDLPQAVSDVIPGLTPTQCYQCPVCPVPRWFGWKSLIQHHRETHEDVDRPQKPLMEPRYIMRPYRLGVLGPHGGRSELSDKVILLPRGWTPTNSSLTPARATIPSTRPHLPIGAPHLAAIGWPQYLQSLGSADVRWLMELVGIGVPTEKDLASFPERRATLERRMGEVDKILIEYLKDANTFLESRHPSVRRAITAG